MRSTEHKRRLMPNCGRNARRLALLATVAAGLVADGSVFAATSTWNVGSSNWNTAANWTPAGVPGAGATVNITNTDGVNRAITYDYTGVAVTLGSLTIDLTGNAANADTLSMAANTLSAATEYVGYSGAGTNGVGVFNQSGGTNTVGTLILGYNATDTGTYFLSNSATLNVSGNEWIGYFGSAVFNQSDGTNSVAGYEYVGTGNAGTTGTYIQTGGSNSAATLYVDDGAGAGVFNLSNGSLSSTNRAYIGYTGSGATFTHTGGTFNALGGLDVGYNAPATYNLESGALSVTGSEIIGAGSAAATFTQNSGGNTVTGDLDIGQNANSNVYNFSAGLLSYGTLTVGGNLNVGNGGNGTLLVNGAGDAVTVTGALNVSATATSTGHLTLTGNGGPCNLSAGSVYIGGNANAAGGSATVTVGPGGALISTGTLALYNTSGNALNLNGGTIDAGQINFGGNSARFNWTSGTFNVGSGGLFVDTTTAPASIGPSYSLGAGKTLIAPGGEWVGYGGNGTFSQTGGSNNATSLVLGAYLGATPANASGSYTLSAGSLAVVAPPSEGQIVVGYVGPGQFNQTGGTLTADLLAVAAFPGINGTVNLSGASSVLINDEVDLGFGGPGVINQSGGTVVVGSSSLPAIVSIGCAVGAVGTYNLSAGSLTINGNVDVGGCLAGGTGLIPGPGGTGLLLIGPGTSAAITGTLVIYNTPGTSVNLSGGSFSVGVMDTMGAPSVFNWSTGTLSLTNTNLAFDALASTAADPLGANFTLTSGQTLVVSQNENIGGLAAGSLTLNTGATNTVVGNLSINAGGTLSLSGGILQAGSINQAGGAITGTLVNQSVFNYQSGTFSGRLVNQGTVNLQGNFTAAGGIENDATFTIAIGRTVTTGATGFDNLGTLNITGGTLAGGPVVNDYGGQFIGYGTIQPVLTNNGSMNITGALTLNSASTNFGTISIAGGSSIRGSNLTNNGSITLTGGAITSPLANPAGGTIAGNGSVTGGLTNNGEVQPGPGTLTVTTAWTNNGLVILGSAGATLSGGAITNTATIEGFGQVAANVLNTTGVVRAQGGELDLSGAGNTIGATAQIQVAADGSVVFVRGLATNAGTIDNVGGSFHNGNQPLTNTSMIEGTGTFDAGSWTNNVGAQLNLTANANVFGPLANAGAIHLYGTNITFFGNVTNTGTVKVTAGSVYFLGANGASIGGTYNSDPSDNYFNNLSITSTGSVTGGTGDRFFMINGTPLTSAGNFNDLGALSANAVSNSGTFLQTGTLIETGNFNNSGTATIGGTQNWSAGTVFTNTTGTAAFQTDAGATGEHLTVNTTSGTVTFASTQHLAGLNIGSGALTTVTDGGSGHRSVILTPAFTDAGTLDLTANDLDVQAGGSAALATTTALIKHGFNNGTWIGTGITSSAAASNTAHLTAVGAILNTTSGGTSIYTAFDGANVAINDVLVKYTYYGDANLDGAVDGSDYTLIDNGFNDHLTGWYNGDFNYDGVVDGSDYTLIDNSFNTQGAVLADTISSPSAMITGQIAGPSGTATAVPEPLAVGVLGLGAIGLLRRRRGRAAG